jgi:hypothetical protein
MIAAACSGNVELTAWVKQQSEVVCNENAMHAAAAMGLIAVCEYLHAEQCLWSAHTCDCAAINGQVHILTWLHEHGCAWDQIDVCTAAAISGSVDVMEYLQQQGVGCTPEALTDMLYAAGAFDKLAAAQWLRQQGAEWPAVLHSLVSCWSGEILAWARGEGCTSRTL